MADKVITDFHEAKVQVDIAVEKKYMKRQRKIEGLERDNHILNGTSTAGTKPNLKKYGEGWERIFGSRQNSSDS